MAMPMPPLNLATSSSASSGVSGNGPVFNFSPPQRLTAGNAKGDAIKIGLAIALTIAVTMGVKKWG